MKAAEFLKRVQEYYGKQYNAVQLESLRGWFSRKDDRLVAPLYVEVVRQYDGRFRLPLVRDLNELWTEVLDTRPGLESSGAKQITDDAGWTDAEMDEALEKFRSIAGRVAEKRRFE